MTTRREKSKEVIKKRGRKKRVPLGRLRSKMTHDSYKIPPDKVGRWINDVGGRLRMAVEAGYEFVEDETISVGEAAEEGRDTTATKVRVIVGKHEGGDPMYSYLMVIDKDLYEQDKKDKEAELRELDEAIYVGELGNQEGGGRYVPRGGIQIKTNVRR